MSSLLTAAALLGLGLLPGALMASPPRPAYSPEIAGPYFSDPALMQGLACPDEKCEGPLSFIHLMRSDLYRPFSVKQLPGKNPFVERPETRDIVAAIRADIDDIRIAGGAPPDQLDPRFLTSRDVRIQLVGVVNRMDRQFHSNQRESACGEVSLIYRFAYPLSRLPVTMNIVFPAAAGKLDCRSVAQRWIAALERQPSMPASAFAQYLLSEAHGPLYHLTGKRIARVELNMQTYRKPAGADATDFGTEATYLIRVFRWNGTSKRFEPSELPNEINRSALVCSPQEDERICRLKRSKRNALVKYLQRPAIVASIDNGTLDVPQALGVLSRRAVSVSPGGQHRSVNQPYWNPASALGNESTTVEREQVISDEQIEVALARTRKAGVKLRFVGNAEDFRQRLNDSTCSGCHQTRAIAGFHFPGLNSPKVQEENAANAVYLAGSPHFYADQPRRLEIVKAIARSKTGSIASSDLTTSFSARPMDKFAPALANTELLGGWGGACLVSETTPPHSKRQWACRADLACNSLFASNNSRGLGTCVPSGRPEIGDYLQAGTVKTIGWGRDTYFRTSPVIAPELPDDEANRTARVFGFDYYVERKTTIDARFLPANPDNNSHYGSHQEFYMGERGERLRQLQSECDAGIRPKSDCYSIRRDRLSGGFPSGMLRLSECIELPSEATCGLVAASGFNDCMHNIGKPGFVDFDLKTCFDYFTAFAGMRACHAASPCRDDYICVAPIHPRPKDAMDQLFRERLQRLQDPSPSNPWIRINRTPYDVGQFGQKRPDSAWINRNDTRGVCIPPYFVFQFRSDRHPAFPQLQGQ